MPTFFPPTFPHPYKAHPQDRPFMARLRQRQAAPLVGINVWLLKDNTVTRDQPANNDDIRRWFQGGAYHKVNGEEAALLEGAGYVLTYDSLGGGYAVGYAEGY